MMPKQRETAFMPRQIGMALIPRRKRLDGLKSRQRNGIDAEER